jgi:hypothetical protein
VVFLDDSGAPDTTDKAQSCPTARPSNFPIVPYLGRIWPIVGGGGSPPPTAGRVDVRLTW